VQALAVPLMEGTRPWCVFVGSCSGDGSKEWSALSGVVLRWAQDPASLQQQAAPHFPTGTKAGSAGCCITMHWRCADSLTAAELRLIVVTVAGYMAIADGCSVQELSGSLSVLVAARALLVQPPHHRAPAPALGCCLPAAPRRSACPPAAAPGSSS
jgi:hypothetical protein